MEVSDIHSEQVPSPIVVSVCGKVMEVNAAHSANTSSPIVFTVVGKVMDISDVQP